MELRGPVEETIGNPAGGGARGRAADPGLVERRAMIEQALGAQPLAPGVTVERIGPGGVPVARVSPLNARADSALLWFHGGGFRLGSAAGWLPFASRLVAAVGRECFLVDYPLAPESPFPAALDAGEVVYRWLAGQGVRIVLAGDSAGGGIAAALALTVAAKEHGGAHVGSVFFSPWLDLRVRNASYEANADHDQQFSRAAAEEAAGLYAVGVPVADPRVSPVLGSWSGQPPVLLETSTTEVLRDDARELAGCLIEAGVQMWFREVPNQAHDWHILYPQVPAGLDSFRLTAAFLDSLAG
ncbi:Esterase/lipase [Frankia canadensis]|uniref:Esterase/lipase n=1 Tax=Frankia canadensis TaxID=1836972 RepID=A0A2I2KJD1_9ACTN|nr:alpha/beta hydrolase fold domain-containing protein [Frankia canadensis]SNQ45768.1 Esterase/lipase [Frankia canadensis]SOU53058.1 Esterase/lipase [Frankia canadensis]